MPVKLSGRTDQSIQVRQMKDGQIGLITSWSPRDYIGLTVQRYGDVLVVLGEKSGAAFTCILCDPDGGLHQECRVRLLQPGDLIEVISN